MKISLIALIAILILSTPFTSDIALAQQDVPFDTYVWVNNPAGDPVDPDWWDYCISQGFNAAFQGTRTGTATHLGTLLNTERGCLDFSLFPIVQSRNIELVFIAANGDELWGFAEADFDFSLAPPRVIEGYFEFAGGTGRFQNATGGGEVLDLDEAPGMVLRIVGTISFKASDRNGH
jgi:hypothetical protein